jgi:hypothetical protein
MVLDFAVKNMSANCYFQQISPQIVEELKFHPSIVALFREAYTRTSLHHDEKTTNVAKKEFYRSTQNFIPSIL